MFDRLKSLYERGLLSAQGVDNAVSRGWITTEQAAEIIG